MSEDGLTAKVQMQLIIYLAEKVFGEWELCESCIVGCKEDLCLLNILHSPLLGYIVLDTAVKI